MHYRCSGIFIWVISHPTFVLQQEIFQTIARSQGLNEESKNGRLTLSKVQCLLNVDLYKMKELVSMLPQKVGRLKIKDRATHVIEGPYFCDRFDVSFPFVK